MVKHDRVPGTEMRIRKKYVEVDARMNAWDQEGEKSREQRERRATQAMKWRIHQYGREDCIQ